MNTPVLAAGMGKQGPGCLSLLDPADRVGEFRARPIPVASAGKPDRAV